MSLPLRDATAQALRDALGARAVVASERPLAGGCVNEVTCLTLRDGTRLVRKAHPTPPLGMFQAEADGLRALARAGALRVPEVISATPHLLLLSYLQPAPGGLDAHAARALGRGLASLHLAAQSDRWGFGADNFLGTSPQPNGWRGDAVTFCREQRLGPQIDRAQRAGLTDPALDALLDRLLDRLPALLDGAGPACLLHGDLWHGNALACADGAPAVFDPAAYYGPREADLAMAALFGGFDPSFDAGYAEVWPLTPGAEARQGVFELYHLLNHLNLFGPSYRAACRSTLRRLLA